MSTNVEELNIRERAIQNAEDALASRVDDSVAASFATLGIASERMQAAADVFAHVVAAFPTAMAKAVSKKEREETGQRQSTLVYGEIQFKRVGPVLLTVLLPAAPRSLYS